MPLASLLIAIGLLFGAGQLAADQAAASPEGTTVNSWRGPPGVAIEPLQTIQGRQMPWAHEIQVALPPSYHSTDRPYPVLWVMDGSHLFETAVLTANLYALSVYPPIPVPEMIVIGVGVPRETVAEYADRRNYDFSPSTTYGFDDYGSEFVDEIISASAFVSNPDRKSGAKNFLSFLVDELRPTLEQQYRLSGDNALWGYSGGGVFCTYALLSRPEAFQRYICGSPGLYSGNKELFRLEKEYAKSHEDLEARAFFSVGEGEAVEGGIMSALGVVSSTARMVEILTLRNYPSLALEFEVLPGEDHLSALPRSLAVGLRAIWRDRDQIDRQ